MTRRYTFKIPKKHAMGLLNKMYIIVQAGRCLFNIFFDDTFQQSEADRGVFRQFDDGEVKIVVCMHVDNILVHAQAASEMFAGELGETFKVKSMVETFNVEKTNRAPASSGVRALSPSE